MIDLSKIKKRNGQREKFEEKKIAKGITAALRSAGEIEEAETSQREAKRLTKIVVAIIKKGINGDMPSVNQIQDVVEQVLMAGGHYRAAKAYILYRDEHKKVREAKEALGVKDDLDLSINQLKVLESRYLRHDQYGKTVETPQGLFKRVARAIAKQEKSKKKQQWWEKKFFQVMANMEFVPAGGYLRSAGTKRPTLANCFVLPVEDDMAAIFDAVKWLALVQQAGGGTGFNFSKLRPKGDYVGTSGGFSTGPVSFMKVFDAATAQVMQGGYKMGANMGVLNVDHPDILEFINCKTDEGEISNFNISVGITNEFMRAVKKNKDFYLRNPRTGQVVQKVKARQIFNQIVSLAWRTGDPGVVFLDTINRDNPVEKTLGRLWATNPCGEQPLHPFDVCNLGSLNLAKMVEGGEEGRPKINWRRLEEVAQIGVRFLDNGVDVSRYPIRQIKQMATANRRIGLGVMGLADMLYQMKVGYNTEEGVKLARKVMKKINRAAQLESEKLAKEKGVFPNWKGSEFEKKGVRRRNLAVTTIAPTGTISMVADCSSGIEPVFALSYVKNVVDDSGLSYVNSYFKTAIEGSGLREEEKKEALRRVAKTGRCTDIEYLPSSIKKVFVTAYDISPEWHVRMQAAIQKEVENAVSKTINFPSQATISDVEKTYMLAWELKCKGVTIYRSGSREGQVLSSGQVKKKQTGQQKIQSLIKLKSLQEKIRENKDSGKQVCPECGQMMEMVEGCNMCRNCGFSKCSL